MPRFKAPTRFADLSLYAVLGVEESASKDEIKRGYRRAALKFHPDHNHSPDANDEFGYLAHAHDVLSNDASRALYDERGEHDSSAASSGSSDSSTASSSDYWRSVFPQVSAAEIEAFREKYVGSEEELEDIKAAYRQHEGNIQHVLDSIPYAEADSVPRLCQLLNQHCKARITTQQQKKLQKKAREWQQREEEEFNQLALDGSAEEKQAAQTAGDMGALVQLFAERNREREEKANEFLDQLTAKYAAPSKRAQQRLTRGKADSRAGNSAKAGKRQSAKGGKAAAEDEEKGEQEGKEEEEEEKDNGDEPSEEEFQRIQAELEKRREANRASGTKGATNNGKRTKSTAERDRKRRKPNK